MLDPKCPAKGHQRNGMGRGEGCPASARLAPAATGRPVTTQKGTLSVTRVASTPGLIPLTDAADRLGKSRHWLNYHVAQGHIPSIRIGVSYYLRAAVLDAMLTGEGADEFFGQVK